MENVDFLPNAASRAYTAICQAYSESSTEGVGVVICCVVLVGLIEVCFECAGIVECIIEEGEPEVFIECTGIVECINVEDSLEKSISYNIKWFDVLNIF